MKKKRERVIAPKINFFIICLALYDNLPEPCLSKKKQFPHIYRRISAPQASNLAYTPNKASTAATKSHWVDANQISLAKYPTAANTIAAKDPSIKILDVSLKFSFIVITPSP